MEKLLNTKDIMERLQCSKDTAHKYMRQMHHMENPLRVPVWALEEWERERMREPGVGADGPVAKPDTARRVRIVIPETDGKHLIPRKRPIVT